MNCVKAQELDLEARKGGIECYRGDDGEADQL